MLKIMLLIILSPFVISCGILSMIIIYVILKRVIQMIIDYGKTINDRDDNQC